MVLLLWGVIFVQNILIGLKQDFAIISGVIYKTSFYVLT